VFIVPFSRNFILNPFSLLEKHLQPSTNNPVTIATCNTYVGEEPVVLPTSPPVLPLLKTTVENNIR
jgi:hypothetical protein